MTSLRQRLLEEIEKARGNIDYSHQTSEAYDRGYIVGIEFALSKIDNSEEETQ